VASYGVGTQPANWNIHSARAAPWLFTLRQVLAGVWPSAFTITTAGVPVLDTSLLASAAEIDTSPQVVVYKLNPQAVWSDGVPITYRDFVYNWQAQSGRFAFGDLGGKRFDPVDEAGYWDVASVAGSPADPFTVTVTFSNPYPDWQSLFSYLMPAHVALRVGFDSGFTDPVDDLVSGGPFLVAALQSGYSLQLTRNARYWGTPANLATVSYYFMGSTAEAVDAVVAGELDVATLLAQSGPYGELRSVGGLSVQAVASSRYEDLDFNEAVPLFHDPAVREAVMLAIDRGAMASTVLGPYSGAGLTAVPVENRVFLSGGAGYSDDGAPYDKPDVEAAIGLLTSKGYTVAVGSPGSMKSGSTATPPGSTAPSAGLNSSVPRAAPVHSSTSPGTGVASSTAVPATPSPVLSSSSPPSSATPNSPASTASPVTTSTLYAPNGHAVTVALVVSVGDPVAQQLAEQVGSDCGAIGIRVDLVELGAGRSRPAGWGMAIEGREVPVFPSAISSRYLTHGPANVDGYSSPAMDRLLSEADQLIAGAGASGTAARLVFYREVDAEVWADFVDLPLVAIPVLVASNSGLLNMRPGPYWSQLAWDAENWGFKAP
ncbi:MAG TPA: ABC transporter substrate-binding protein, partial [Acidimicrobiales bacterium]|nr:ABC transporter substrate-binding protein [Acidimicrobiales bacterium]